MAEAFSSMQPLGTVAPVFTLPDVHGQSVSLSSFDGAPALLVMFICNHCPYVKHVQHSLTQLVKEYQERGVQVVGINSNDAQEYPDDSPEKMLEESEKIGYTFAYLVDETQEVAKAYGAACTPDFFVYDSEKRLAYRGQMDGSRPSNEVPNDGVDLRRALDAILAGEKVAEPHLPSLGCNIKWKTQP